MPYESAASKTMRTTLSLIAFSVSLQAQISGLSVQTTQSQAVLTYTAPDANACAVQVADMNRSIVIISAVQGNGMVTITAKAPHGLLAGAVVYLENSGVSGWDGYETVASVPSSSSFTFSSPVSGTSNAGVVGVLADDVNPALYNGANLDSRTGSITRGRARQFVIGLHDSPVGLDGNRYSRALQVASRHVYTLTCGSNTMSGEFITSNAPVGFTLGATPPIDRSNSQYGYPTIQWANQYQALIDPVTGFLSRRATAPSDAPACPGAASCPSANVAQFVTAIDLESAWQSPAKPLTGGAGNATFTSPCRGTNCYLFLRADNLTIGAGATYANDTNSALDWVQVKLTSAQMSSACTGDDCKISVCLTLNGQTCVTPAQDVTLSTSAASYTIGSTHLMDLWQGSGAPAIASPDVSQATGTVTYVASAKTLTWSGGNKFSTKWAAGSRISVNAVQYSIASVKNENVVVLSAGPGSDITNPAPYSANNFGVLIKKKTAAVNTVSIGYTTYNYGISAFSSWGSDSTDTVSRTTTPNAAGVPGYNAIIARELYWIAVDGSAVNDLGFIQTQWIQGGYQSVWAGGQGQSFWGNTVCGSGPPEPNMFDPKDANTWYCVMNSHVNDLDVMVIKGQYIGDHRQGVPGQVIPSCDVSNNSFSPNVNPPPCLRFTVMMPNGPDMLVNGTSVTNTGPGNFNPDFSLYPAAQPQDGIGQNWNFAGVSSDGFLAVFTRGLGAQNSPGWFAIYNLGNSAPVGTRGGMSIVAMGSTFLHWPIRWCGTHAVNTPAAGWIGIAGDSTWTFHDPAQFGFGGTITSGAIAANNSAQCPANTFGAPTTGTACTPITLSTSSPVRGVDGLGLGPILPGDLMLIESETFYVITMSGTNVLAYRPGPVSHAANISFLLNCGPGTYAAQGMYWHYTVDPLGRNVNGDNVADLNGPGGHSGGNDFLQFGSGYNGATGPTSQCPSVFFPGNNAPCLELRYGTGSAIVSAPILALAAVPPFAGKGGAGGLNNEIDTHPAGRCIGNSPGENPWCATPYTMNDYGPGPENSGFTACSGSGCTPSLAGTPTIWKYTAAQGAVLNRKIFQTAGYAGRTPLADVSGPSSDVTAAQNTYCYAVAANECLAGSVVGDIYINAPFVSTGQCVYPGIAVQPDDRNAICIFDSQMAGNVWQVGVTGQDMTGSRYRTTGNLFARWNQQGVFWNAITPATGTVMFSQARWLDGVRNEDILTVLPPFPVPDTTARNTFVNVPVLVTPPPGAQVDNVVVEFGYAENGDPTKFFCSSRQEACVAVSGSVNVSNPYSFEFSESYQGFHCSGRSCVVTIPALPQRVVYYRCKYRDASSAVIAVSGTGVVTTP